LKAHLNRVSPCSKLHKFCHLLEEVTVHAQPSRTYNAAESDDFHLLLLLQCVLMAAGSESCSFSHKLLRKPRPMCSSMCNFSISALNIQSNQCCVHLLHSWMIVPTRVHELSHVCLLAFPGMLKRRQQQREAVKSQVQVCMFCFVILSSYLRCLFFNIPEVSLADLFLELSST